MLFLKQIEIKINCVSVNYFLLFQSSLLSVVNAHPAGELPGKKPRIIFNCLGPASLCEFFRASLFQVLAELL